MRRVKALLVTIAAAGLCAGSIGIGAQSSGIAPPPIPADPAAASVKRLQELVAVINKADAAATRAYIQRNSTGPAGWPSYLVSVALERYRLSRGLELVRMTTIGPQPFQPQLRGTAVAILRNRVTGDEETLAIAVEPEPPHRITGFPVLHPSLIAMLAPPVQSLARSEPEQLEEIGAYLKRLADADIFSGVVVIARDGDPVFSHAYGYADRDRKIANTVATPFLLGSTNKLFTSLAIGQLAEQGQLSYEDPVSKFLPDYPDRESARRIRIKHLLSHTSGLGDYTTSKVYKESLDRMRTVEALLDAGREPAKFEPGAKWSYSNTGFVLLGRILEIVTGEDYYEYMGKHVFAPAGMHTASFPILPRDGVATVPMAYPYEVEFDGRQQRIVNTLGADFRRGSPSGVGIASALDLVNAARAIRAGRIVTSETFRLHSTPKPELGVSHYGYGVAVGARMAKRPLVGHGGNAAGQCTEFGELRDTPYTIVVLSNLTIGTCMTVTGKVLRVLTPAGTPLSPGHAPHLRRKGNQ